MAKIKGTKFDDINLAGTEFADEIDGDDGNDIIFGLGGDDIVRRQIIWNIRGVFRLEALAHP